MLRQPKNIFLFQVCLFALLVGSCQKEEDDPLESLVGTYSGTKIHYYTVNGGDTSAYIVDSNYTFTVERLIPGTDTFLIDGERARIDPNESVRLTYGGDNYTYVEATCTIVGTDSLIFYFHESWSWSIYGWFVRDTIYSKKVGT